MQIQQLNKLQEFQPNYVKTQGTSILDSEHRANSRSDGSRGVV